MIQISSADIEHIAVRDYCYEEWRGRTSALDILKAADPQWVVDLGANVGIWGDLCRDLLPSLKRYTAIEPDAENFTILSSNFPTADLIDAAIFYGAGDTVNVQGCGDGNRGGYMVKGIAVEDGVTYGPVVSDYPGKQFRCMTLEAALQDQVPDAIKLDCEASEYNIIQHSPLLKKIPLLLVEFHNHTIEYVESFISQHLPDHTILDVVGSYPWFNVTLRS